MKLRDRLPIMASVETFSHDGRGIARIDGKVHFIHGALPDETISCKLTSIKSDFNEGYAVEVLNPSPLRAVPKCVYFETCGGCSLHHLEQQAQINVKQDLLLNLLERVGHVTPEKVLSPITSKPYHYRNKARLSVRFVNKKNQALVGFRERLNSRYIADIDQCVILNKQVGDHLIDLKELITSLNAPHAIAQIELAAGEESTALIFRNLAILDEEDISRLKEFAERFQFTIYLQPKGPDSVYLLYPEDAPAYLTYRLPAEDIRFNFLPTDFTQVNADLNQLMIARAIQLMDIKPSDNILDLFCGLGNFSLPMAKHAQWVTGVEGSNAMVDRAYMNAALNGLENVTFQCANLDCETALTKLESISVNKLLLDPPRAGALEIVKKIEFLNLERIVYVSCNPATLARDSDILVNQKGYRLVASGVMDMFPHTAHVESIALFVRG